MNICLSSINSAKVHIWKNLQLIINPPKHNISKIKGRTLFSSRWKKWKVHRLLKKGFFSKSAKRHLQLSDLQNSNWTKKFHLRSTTYTTFSGDHSFISKNARVLFSWTTLYNLFVYLLVEMMFAISWSSLPRGSGGVFTPSHGIVYIR